MREGTTHSRMGWPGYQEGDALRSLRTSVERNLGEGQARASPPRAQQLVKYAQIAQRHPDKGEHDRSEPQDQMPHASGVAKLRVGRSIDEVARDHDHHACDGYAPTRRMEAEPDSLADPVCVASHHEAVEEKSDR